MKCRQCGKEIPVEFDFCPHCGYEDFSLEINKAYIEAMETVQRLKEEMLEEANRLRAQAKIFGETAKEKAEEIRRDIADAAESAREEVKNALGKKSAKREAYAAMQYSEGQTRFSSGDFVGAVECYTRAADGGNASALNALASCYEKGIGVEKDIEKAAFLYEKAAEQNVVGAREKADYLKNGYGKIKRTK